VKLKISWLAIGILCWLIVVLITITSKFNRMDQAVQASGTYPPRNGDPCTIQMRVQLPINLTASGQLITGVANKQVYICTMQFVTTTAQNIALVEGTGATCGTNTVGIAGGNTAATGWNLAANQVIAFDNPGYWSVSTATAADNVCLLLSGAGQTSGYIQFVTQ
jgi:hypothetical protein